MKFETLNKYTLLGATLGLNVHFKFFFNHYTNIILGTTFLITIQYTYTDHTKKFYKSFITCSCEGVNVDLLE